MSKPGKQAQATPLFRLLRIIYWVVFSLALVIVLVYAAFRLLISAPTVDADVPLPSTQVTDPLPGQSTDPAQPQPLTLTRQEGVYTCLLAGADDGNGCADTIMLGVFDTVNQQATLVSIPRDTLVNIQGRDYKINATYGLGGAELLCDTVADMLCVPVDFYVMVDLNAFQHIVNEIGGVWFTVPVDMDYEDPYQNLSIHISAGYQLLNGQQAVGVMRCRNCYPDADLGRVRTQRAFLVALAKQTITLSNVSRVSALMEILNTYVDSDMSLNDMIYFATQAIGMDLDTGLTSQTLPGDWIYPAIQLRDEEVLELVNGLGLYQEEVPLDALNIRHK